MSGNGGIENGGEALSRLPWIAEAPVTPLARAMFRTVLPDASPAISAHRRGQLEAAAARLDHYGRPGEWVYVAARILATWAEGESWGRVSEPPRSLGALALELKAEANSRRCWVLRRRRERLRPLAAMLERDRIKRRRLQRRARRG